MKEFPSGHECCKYTQFLLFDDNKINMARKPGKKQKENAVGCNREGKSSKGNVSEELRECKTGTVLEVSLEVRCCCCPMTTR